MFRIGRLAAVALTVIAASSPARSHAHDTAQSGQAGAAQPHPGVGNARFTDVGDDQAQAYADNGAQLVFAFERQAAEAAFRTASRVRPSCLPCRLGALWAAGSGFDVALSDAERSRLRTEATLLLPSDRTRATAGGLFGLALAERYAFSASEGERRFAQQMEDVARKHPTVPLWSDITAFAWLQTFAQAPDQTDALQRARRLLDATLAKWPDDVGAIHLMLHVLERTGETALARPLAERLPKLAPNASHLLHMPAHLAIAEGRFADAVVASRAALAADERWARAQGSKAWDLPMHGHNVLYSLIAATNAGAAKEGLGWVTEALSADFEGIETTFWAQEIRSAAYLAEACLSNPRAMRPHPKPSGDRSYESAMWWLAKGIAAARAQDRRTLDQAIAALRNARGLDALGAQAEATQTIGLLFLRAKAADLSGAKKAARRLRAAAIERRNREIDTRGDPPLWWLPLNE